jgi:hypothetical protein
LVADTKSIGKPSPSDWLIASLNHLHCQQKRNAESACKLNIDTENALFEKPRIAFNAKPRVQWAGEDSIFAREIIVDPGKYHRVTLSLLGSPKLRFCPALRSRSAIAVVSAVSASFRETEDCFFAREIIVDPGKDHKVTLLSSTALAVVSAV